MAITENGLLEYESGQAFQDWEDMSNTGDDQTFSASFAPWSGRSGFSSSVAPWGLATGGAIRPDTGTNDSVLIAASTAYMPGTVGADANGLVNIASGSVTAGRAAVDTHMVTSVTITAAGALAAVEGLQGTSFTEVRGAAGGPPYIPVDSVEIGQVRVASGESAEIVEGELFQSPGAHQERWDFPVWREDPATGEVYFSSPLPLIHTGDVPKKIGVKGFVPIFTELPWCSDWVPADESHSVSSTQTYTGPRGSVSRTLGQASFTHRAENGITDNIVRLKNLVLWFRWHQDRNRAPYQLTQGMLGVAREFPVGNDVVVNATVSAQQGTVDFDG